MINTYFPVSTNAASAASQAQTSAASGQKTLDFSRILLAQMATPNISSLFGDQGEENNSIFGSSANSLFGGAASGSLLSQLSGNSTGQSFSPSMELSIWSNLIGKTVEATNAANKKTSGKVESVLLQNGIAMLNVEGSIVDPKTVIQVK